MLLLLKGSLNLAISIIAWKTFHYNLCESHHNTCFQYSMYLKIQLHIGSTKVCHLEEQCFGKKFSWVPCWGSPFGVQCWGDIKVQSQRVCMFDGRSVWTWNARQKENRDKKRNIQRQRIDLGGQPSKYWIHPRLFFIYFIYHSPKGKKAKDCFIMIQRTE